MISNASPRQPITVALVPTSSRADQSASPCSLLLVMTWKYCCCCWTLRRQPGRPGVKVQSRRSKSRFFLFTLVSESSCQESGHVGKYGRAEAPSDDQPVCFDGWMRRGSGEAASPSGPLAVWGEFVRLISSLRNVHPLFNHLAVC